MRKVNKHLKGNDVGVTKNIYAMAEHYDSIYRGHDGDVDYYLDVAGRGKCLYLGIGTGRIFGALSKKNPDAYGLDSSSAMLKIFRSKFPYAKNKVIKCNALNIKTDFGKFDVIIAPYAFLNYFNSEEIIKILENVRICLKPKGKFITDIFSPFRNPHFNSFIEKIHNGEAQTLVTYDFIKQKIEERTLINTHNGEKELILKNYYYYPNEFAHLLKSVGFKVKIFGGFKKEEVTTETDFILFESSL